MALSSDFQLKLKMFNEQFPTTWKSSSGTRKQLPEKPSDKPSVDKAKMVNALNLENINIYVTNTLNLQHPLDLEKEIWEMEENP